MTRDRVDRSGPPNPGDVWQLSDLEALDAHRGQRPQSPQTGARRDSEPDLGPSRSAPPGRTSRTRGEDAPSPGRGGSDHRRPPEEGLRRPALRTPPAMTDYRQEPPSEPSLDSSPPDPTAAPPSSDRVFRGFALDHFQATAIDELERGNSVLVSAPTGTGKTIIADWVVEQALKEGREVVYTAPIKALSNQKYRDYTRLYGKQNVGLITGDLVIHQEAPIRIMTTEIMRNILLQRQCSDKLSHVVVDEVHFLEDEERGTVWEELLIYLPARVKIVALSATLPNIDEFAAWLEHVRGDRVAVIKESRRAVPLRLLAANRSAGILDLGQLDAAYKRWLERGREREDHRAGDVERDSRTGREEMGHWEESPSDRRGPPRRGREDSRGREDRRGGRGPSDHRGDHRGDQRGHDRHRGGWEGRGGSRDETRHLDMVHLATPDFLPVLYFVFSRRQTELFARELSRRLRQSYLNPIELAKMEGILRGFEDTTPNVLTVEHREMYLRGLAFHHAGLHVALKALVEDLYEQKLIKVLYCTSTFALGINMPARSVIFDSLKKFNGQTMAPLTVRQFLQKAGRAGRRGMDKVGYVLIRSDFADYEENKLLLKTYQRAEHERINSAFNLAFSSVVSLLHQHSQDEIRQILEKSFLNFTARKQLERQREELQAQASRAQSSDNRNRGELLKRWKKQLGRVEQALNDQDGLIYKKFVEKVDFLKGAGYLNDDLSFNAGAKALMNIQINEILMTELLLEGVFEEVEEDELFGVLCGLVQDLPRSVTLRDPLRGRWSKIRDRIRRIREGHTVSGAAEMLSLPVTFCPELMPYGQLWAQGHPLSALMLTLHSDIDISGDLVGAFRRARDLAGQLRSAYQGDTLMMERLTRLMTKTGRDEVEVLD